MASRSTGKTRKPLKPSPISTQNSDKTLAILKTVFDIGTLGLAFVSVFKNRGIVQIPERNEDFTLTPAPPRVG